MISIILITHGIFGEELLRTAQDIIGRQEQVAALSVLPDTGVERLGQTLDEAISRLKGADGALFLVDMLGGTPCNTALLKMRGQSAEIVTGVNLYMVLSAFRHRANLELKALAAKVAEDGRRAIVSANELLASKLGKK